MTTTRGWDFRIQRRGVGFFCLYKHCPCAEALDPVSCQFKREILSLKHPFHALRSSAHHVADAGRRQRSALTSTRCLQDEKPSARFLLRRGENPTADSCTGHTAWTPRETRQSKLPDSERGEGGTRRPKRLVASSPLMRKTNLDLGFASQLFNDVIRDCK